MAPRSTPATKRAAGDPDGAPPGAEVPPAGSQRFAFDADAKAKAREGAPVTIGGVPYRRVRKNWDATRALRGLLRTQERHQTKQARVRRRLEALDVDADESAFEALEQDIDALTDAADEVAYEVIQLLLRDDDGQPPVIDHLKEHLDVEEAGELGSNLANGGEPDPTPAEIPPST